MNDRSLHKVGFTLIEMILVIAIFGILGTITLHFFAAWQPRLELRGAARETQFLIHRARMEAIRRGVYTVVQADPQTGSLVAYADVNGDPVAGNPGHARYLRYDPDPSIGNKKTDYEIGQIRLGRSSFGAPPSYGVIEGFTDVPGEPDVPAVLVFSPMGSIEATGALRFADGSGRNYIEAAVTSRVGKVEVRKFLKADDSPTSSAGFFQEGAGSDGANVWVWY
jgi:prepilin-type N-terminal cleavage/methylation domain-containing protein